MPNCKVGDLAMIKYGVQTGEIVTCLLWQGKHFKVKKYNDLWVTDKKINWANNKGEKFKQHLMPDKYLMRIGPNKDLLQTMRRKFKHV